MKITEFRKLIREEVRKALKEANLDPINQKLKDRYIDAYVTLTVDPYAAEYDDSLPTFADIMKHAKRYGYEDTLVTIDKMPDVVSARSKYQMGSQDDPLASKALGTNIGNRMMRDPLKNLTKKGKMNKLDVDRLKDKIKQNLGLDY